jgi:asparagine synthetase B (glutamine-hydrolysing)
MKSLHGIDTDVGVLPGAEGADYEPLHSTASGPVAAEMSEFADTSPSAADVLPAGVLNEQQCYAAVSVVVCHDDTMEAIVYVHETFPDERGMREEMRRVGAMVEPLDVDVVTVGEWIRPVHNQWTQQPYNESTWANKQVNELQIERKETHETAKVKHREIEEREREWSVNVYRMWERCKDTLDIEEVGSIMETHVGTKSLAAASNIADSVCKEEDLLALRATYVK